MASYLQRFHSDLARLAGEGADASRIAERAVTTWGNIFAALVPIIGTRGVAALFKRSLLLTGVVHTSLVRLLDDPDAPGNFDALRATLEQQSSANAIALNGALLQSFSELLINLIGESLTERLLQAVPDYPSSDNPVREEQS